MKNDIDRVADKLVEVVTLRQFRILFEAALHGTALGCPPVEFRYDVDVCGSDQGEADVCLDCWRNYTRCQALLDLGFIHKIEMKRDEG